MGSQWSDSYINRESERMTLFTRITPRRSDFVAMKHNPRADFIAGLSVAVVALPLALAFGVSSGVGAGAGIATAIVAGLVAAIFGGSRLQVSGPTGAMTVVLVPIALHFGPSAVFVVGFMAGVILLVMTFAGAAHSMRYIPISVIEGFTLGIAMLIGLQQIPMALGVKAQSSSVVGSAWRASVAWFKAPTFASINIAIFCALFILILARVRSGFPAGIVAVALTTIAVWVEKLDVHTVGDVPRSLSFVGLPHLGDVNVAALIIPALSVAGLAAIEGLLCATVADSMAGGTPHNPHQELFGQSLANLVASLFGGVPATAAIARTAVNVRSGATSRLAAISHSLILWLCIAVASGLVAHIPLPALAGVLIATALRMVDVERMRNFAKETNTDFFIVAITAAATLFLDLVEAVAVGLVIAGIISAFQNRYNHETHEHQVDDAEIALEHALHPVTPQKEKGSDGIH